MKRQITDLISENLTDSYLEGTRYEKNVKIQNCLLQKDQYLFRSIFNANVALIDIKEKSGMRMFP